MKDSNYFVICGWMVNRLKLKGNELMLFAIVYGFSQADGTWYTGTQRYLSEMIGGADLKTVRAALSSLEKKGYIQRKEEERNGVRFCLYRASDDVREFLPDLGKNSLPPRENFPTPLGKNSLPLREKLPTPIGKISPPIIEEDNNNKINKYKDSDNTRTREGIHENPAVFLENPENPVGYLASTGNPEKPSALGSCFIPYPSNPSEVVEVATRIGKPMNEQQAQAFIDYYAATGWTIRGARITDWRHKVGNWCDRQREIDARQKAQPLPQLTVTRQTGVMTRKQDYGKGQRGYQGD